MKHLWRFRQNSTNSEITIEATSYAEAVDLFLKETGWVIDEEDEVLGGWID